MRQISQTMATCDFGMESFSTDPHRAILNFCYSSVQFWMAIVIKHHSNRWYKSDPRNTLQNLYFLRFRVNDHLWRDTASPIEWWIRSKKMEEIPKSVPTQFDLDVFHVNLAQYSPCYKMVSVRIVDCIRNKMSKNTIRCITLQRKSICVHPVQFGCKFNQMPNVYLVSSTEGWKWISLASNHKCNFSYLQIGGWIKDGMKCSVNIYSSFRSWKVAVPTAIVFNFVNNLCQNHFKH